MYPNYVGSEAVLASENLIFTQHRCDTEAFNACLHPFIRNTVGCMEFGGTLLNKRMNKTNDGGTERKTTDVFQIATAVLFQNPIQNFALAPNNLTDAPKPIIDFMKDVPTTWGAYYYHVFDVAEGGDMTVGFARKATPVFQGNDRSNKVSGGGEVRFDVIGLYALGKTDADIEQFNATSVVSHTAGMSER